jgi:peptide/nickel transport system substrate-binding protein
VSTDAETLDPRHATDPVGVRTSRLLHAGLVRLDPDTLEPKPFAASALTWLDARTLRVELRDGVRFHGGAPLGPEDVIATIAAFKSPAVGSRHARVVEPIGSVEADGPRAVLVKLARPHATLLTDLELPILRRDEAASAPRPDGTLDGLGPFVIARREHGAITLAPAAHGVMPPPAKWVTIRTVHDENARALRMHAGRADLVVNGFSPTLLPALEGAAGLVIGSRPAANLTYMVLRTDRGPLADARVRRALGAALDRDALARTLLGGRARAAETMLPETHWAFTPAAPSPRDPARARALLEEAGVRGLHLTLLTSTDRLRGVLARAIAQELEDVGVTVEVVPLELGTMIARLGSGDFELATLQLPELTEPNVLRVFLHSTSVPPAGANRGRVRDADVDRLLDEGDAVLEPAKRRAIYARLEARVREQALLLPLFHEDHVTVASARAAGFRPSAEGRWLGLADLR